MLMLPIMEINVPSSYTHPSTDEGPATAADLAAAAGGYPSSSTPPAPITAQQQAPQHTDAPHGATPRLKRSPYLAAMCTTTEHVHYDEMMMEVVVTPPPPQAAATVGEPSNSAGVPTTSTAALSSSGLATSRRGSGHKRQYTDFFELKRPSSSSSQTHHHGLGGNTRGKLSVSVGPGVSATGSNGVSPSYSYQSTSTYSSGGAASGGNFSHGSNGSSSKATTRPGRGSSYTKRRLVGQRMPSSIHSLPQACRNGGTSSAAPAPNLQYYYPNPFNSGGNLLSLMRVNRNCPGQGLSNVNDNSSDCDSGSSAIPESNSSDEDEDETTAMRCKNIRMSDAGGRFAVSPGAFWSNGAQQSKGQGQQPPQPHQATHHTHHPLKAGLKQKQAKYQQYRSLPAIHHVNSSHNSHHQSTQQFFPSVLDPLDGMEWDVNKESRNQAWKEICVTAVTDCDGDEGMHELDDSSDNNSKVQQVASPVPRFGSHNISSTSTPCVSDDNQCLSDGSEALEELFARKSHRNNNCSTASSPRSSGVMAPPARRSLTVGAGLAYGRIPDWHVRSRLSKD